MILSRIFGVDFGNFSPSQLSQADWAAKLAATVKNLKPDVPGNSSLFCNVERIFAPRVAFTTNIARLGESELETYRDANADGPGVIRTKDKADGMILPVDPHFAVAICNADCPIIVIEDRTKYAVLHAGYRCLIREDKNEEGIIEQAMKHFHPGMPTTVKIFGGIGDCCYAFDYPEAKDANLVRYPDILREAMGRTKADRTWKQRRTSIDLYLVAKRILQQCGVHESQMNIDETCTCCAGFAPDHPDQLEFWSHSRVKANGGQEGRNLCLVSCQNVGLSREANPSQAVQLE